MKPSGNKSPVLETMRPTGLPGGKIEDNAPVNIDAILQMILGRGGERFGMVAAVLQGERIIAQGAAGVRKRGTPQSASRSMIAFTLVPAPKE